MEILTAISRQLQKAMASVLQGYNGDVPLSRPSLTRTLRPIPLVLARRDVSTARGESCQASGQWLRQVFYFEEGVHLRISDRLVCLCLFFIYRSGTCPASEGIAT